ncbi:MAG TPA: NAD(P)H-dependent oxidoreductase [Spirochaetia bacterium]|nr:NAD(P)H-dependent oxidoreductase [Spirochaetia bacterium]
MKIACISDKGGRSALSEDLWRKLRVLAEARGHALQRIELDRDEVSSCTGCFLCWKTASRECVSRDPIGNLTRAKLDADLAVWLAPVVFGTASSAVKNAMDRGDLLWLNPKRAAVVIGYSEDMDNEERSTFLDLIRLHRGAKDVVHPENKEDVSVFATRSARDNDFICRRLGDML